MFLNLNLRLLTMGLLEKHTLVTHLVMKSGVVKLDIKAESLKLNTVYNSLLLIFVHSAADLG